MSSCLQAARSGAEFRSARVNDPSCKSTRSEALLATSGRLLSAKPGEIQSEFDLDTNLWIAPVEQIKRSREHVKRCNLCTSLMSLWR